MPQRGLFYHWWVFCNMPQKLSSPAEHLYHECTYATAARAKLLSHRPRLTAEFKSDLRWWLLFVTSWNGVSFLHCSQEATFNYHLWTNASGKWGCGAKFVDQWLQFRWPPEWTPITIMAKELVPIILSCVVWGRRLNRKKVHFFCDNLSLVDSIKKVHPKTT